MKKEKENNEKTEETKENKKINCEIFKKKEIWISGAVGFIVGILVLLLLQALPISKIGNVKIGNVIITSKAGNITENDLLDELLKEGYSIPCVTNLINKKILEKKYKLTKEQEEEINKNLEDVLKFYKDVYGYTEEQFIESNGYDSKEDLKDLMRYDYIMNLYYKEKVVKSEDIEKFYNENDIYGEITTKHILVQTSEDVTEDQALATAKEIITKLNSGKSFDEVAEEYSEKAISEEVKFDFFNQDSFAENYITASKALAKDEYTKEPVKTNFGYHVILCTNKADKPELKDARDKIADSLIKNLSDVEIEKALIELRKENKVKFVNKEYQNKYDKFCEQVNAQQDEY